MQFPSPPVTSSAAAAPLAPVPTAAPSVASLLERREDPFETSTTGGQRLETTIRAMTRSIHLQETPVSAAFFSVQNIDAIQGLLRDVIRRRTGYAIDRQSDDALLAVMRHVYVRDSANVARDVRGEVRRLNAIVVQEAAPIVASGMAQYLAYVRDSSRIAQPLPRAQQTSIKGSKTAELFRPL
jgi:hypothetical protein